MLENGYISLYRSLLDSEIMTKPPEYFKLWIVILLRCNFEDHGIYKRGELVTKYEYLASEAGVPLNTIDKFLRWASDEKRNMVETQKLTRGVKIRVIKYDDFQVKSETEAKQKRNTVDTINKGIRKEGNKQGEETVSPTAPPIEKKKTETVAHDYYDRELERVTDPELITFIREWWTYKGGYKSYKTPSGWKMFIGLVLENDKSVIIASIKKAMANSWKGIRPQDEIRDKARGTTQKIEYYGLLDEWPEAIQITARNEMRDYSFINKRQIDENMARNMIAASVVKYYKQPGKVTPDQAAELNTLIDAWRERNNCTEVETTPNNVTVNAIRSVIFKK